MPPNPYLDHLEHTDDVQFCIDIYAKLMGLSEHANIKKADIQNLIEVFYKRENRGVFPMQTQAVSEGNWQEFGREGTCKLVVGYVDDKQRDDYE
ncbi:Uu.00g026740.m01.CDS01 [Anthostomella pinea]|uniref:Uu.00g026740.m01.CDS01 n=1 Tax=Anthostomella pinea TaxID=933095 RepID=A0AAI8V7K6_9PEZI|nr:Uu.00g026740.m01.CDS01 [Anthostomella pinea]